MSRQEDLRRIAQGLERARAILSEYTAGSVEHRFKSAGDPVTEADTRVNDALRECLPRDGEGWLSEETVDDPARLKCERVWIVDPLDGTREFVEGVPEWCVSIGLIEGGRPVAGGICNPTTDQTVLVLDMPAAKAVRPGFYRVILRVNGRQARNSPSVHLVAP